MVDIIRQQAQNIPQLVLTVKRRRIMLQRIIQLLP